MPHDPEPPRADGDDPVLAALWLSELWQPVREYHGETFRRRRHPEDDAPAPDPTRARPRA